MGRLCYKSFGTEMNANITRVREGNEGYIGNILKTQHGSVLEHASATIGFIDVSPVVTHELVRHRAGTAFSQVSMRFVRLQEIGFYMPQAFGVDFLTEMVTSISDEDWEEIKKSNTEEWASREEAATFAAAELEAIVTQTVEFLEKRQLQMARLVALDNVGNFGLTG
jgi:thymidylate synthase (FAD)